MIKKKILSLVMACSMFLSAIPTVTLAANNTVELQEVSQEEKMSIGRNLLIGNALYQKNLEYLKDLNRSISLFGENKISEGEFFGSISNVNTKSTYYYLLFQNVVSVERIKSTSDNIAYNLYLGRRATEELFKYMDDKSDLRLKVSQDLLQQAIAEENNINNYIARDLARYDIPADAIYVDASVFTDESILMANADASVIFEDLNSTEYQNYEYYLTTINDAFMLISWELQNIYLTKADYESGAIPVTRMISNIDQSAYIITNIYDRINFLTAPKGLEKLEVDSKKTVTLYFDALVELQKFNMDFQLDHFEKAMKIVNQADTAAGRIGEFIYSVRYQYRNDL